MEILILGGTEFVSCALAKKLLSKNYVVDIFTRGFKPITYNGVRNHLIGDRRNINDVRNALKNKKYDVVFDISGYSREDVENIIKEGSHNNISHYVFCSTMAVYKKTKEIIVEETSCEENDEWDLTYASNKKKAEDYLISLYQDKNFPITILRPTYIYGEGNNVYREAFIFDRINLEKPIFIANNDTCVQFVHVNDLACVFESVIHSKSCIGQIYNVANTQKINWETYVTACMKAVGKSTKIIKVTDEYLESLNLCLRDVFPFYDTSYLINIDKLSKDNLYIPQIDITKGLKNAYDWYRNNKPIFKDGRLEKITLLDKEV